jgi:hypothetical protein
VSDQVNVGGYSLEISGDEVLVRDESGAIVEAVELDEINGELTLPDGEKIDLASVLADAGIDLNTAAGAANDNAGAAHGGSSFTAFHGAQDRLGGLNSAGALDDTSLGFVPSLDVPSAANDFQVQQHTSSSFDWARHETDQSQPGWSDETDGSHGNLPQLHEDDEEIARPSFPPLQDDGSTGPGDSDGDVPQTNEQQQSAGQGDMDEPSVPPTDEQDQPENLGNDDGPFTPPTDEQEQPEDEPQEYDPVTPPTDEQDQGEDEQKDQQSAAPPSDEQDQGEDEQEDQQSAAPPSDEQDQGEDEQEDQQSAAPPSDESDQSGSDEQTDDPVTPPMDEQDQGEDEQQDPPAEQPQLVPQGNAAPTDIQLAGATVVENTSGAVIGALSVVDPDVGDTHSFTVSDDRFEVVNGHLKLKDGVSLDFEDKASIDITVTAKDSGGNELAEVFTISVGNVNEAPVVTADGGHFDAKDSSSLQPTVDFSDVDSDTLSQAVIHTTGFQSGDVLNIPNSGLFNVTVNHGTADYTITITGKTGTETLDQYEDFANSISFSSNSQAEGDRHIQYSVTDSGGASSNVASADIAVTVSHDLYTSQLGKGQTTLGGGDDLLHIDSKNYSPVRAGDGYDTVHLEQQNRSFDHNDAIKLENVEAIDTTGYGTNKVSLSIHDVVNMTDDDNRLTIVGDQGDTVTLTGSGNNHWTVVESNGQFTTYAYSDPAMQAVVEVSNQMNTQVS